MTWVLKEVDKDECDICGSWAVVNVYARPLTCECNKCQQLSRSKFEYFHVCGNCFNQWAKTNAQYLELD